MLLLDAALAYIRAGLSVIPCRAADDANRPKAPALASWKVYQSFLATEDEARDWWPQHKALAVVCGAVSGNLEIIDFDDFDAFEAWHQIALHEAPNLLEALTIVGTPSGGRHVYYRCESPPPGNQKLARDTDGSTLIETRGEGGYALAPPSKGYELLESGVPLSLSLNNITDAERDVLLGVARSLDLYAPARAAQNEPLPIERVEGDPGTDFNTRGWAECASALTSAGWRLIRRTSSGASSFARARDAASVRRSSGARALPTSATSRSTAWRVPRTCRGWMPWPSSATSARRSPSVRSSYVSAGTIRPALIAASRSPADALALARSSSRR
ncbi:MAG: bifunctional DNA primase/polymerase [Bacteroidetes bacterium]|nr:bifunctional DNA primase/polymerase [Bacteroidota bacterium]